MAPVLSVLRRGIHQRSICVQVLLNLQSKPPLVIPCTADALLHAIQGGSLVLVISCTPRIQVVGHLLSPPWPPPQVAEKRPMVHAPAVRAHHKAASRAQRAHIVVAHLRGPIHTPGPGAEAAAGDTEAPARPARLDLAHDRAAHGGEHRGDQREQEEQQRDGAASACCAALREGAQVLGVGAGQQHAGEGGEGRRRGSRRGATGEGGAAGWVLVGVVLLPLVVELDVVADV